MRINRKRFIAFLMISFFTVSAVIVATTYIIRTVSPKKHSTPTNISKEAPRGIDKPSEGLIQKKKIENEPELKDTPGILKIPILMYHEIQDQQTVLSVSRAHFDEQLSFLKQQGYESITLDDFYDFKVNNKPLPNKPFIITFDDGYEDNYTNAYPIIKKYNFKATIFVVPGLVNKKTYLTWNMIKKMSQSGFIQIESHTMTHANLTKIKPEIAEKEINDSKKVISIQTGKKVNYFAYPYGFYNGKVMEMVRKAGYKGAVITAIFKADNRADKNNNLFEIHRIFIGDKITISNFARRLGVIDINKSVT